MKLNDDIFKELASRYVEQDGSRLKAEAATMQRRAPYYDVASLDRKVSGKVRLFRFIRVIRIGVPAAACLAVLITSFNFLTSNNLNQPSKLMLETTATADQAADAETGQEYPLVSLRLPDGYAVSGTTQDQGETIYFIDHSQADDVILTIRQAEGGIDLEGLEEVTILGTPAYGLWTKDYSLLIFEKDGLVYSLSCLYEYPTLVEIAETILSPAE